MISAHEHKLSIVLGDQFLHEIPPYQRPYAWTEKEAEELFDDLREAARAGSNEPYFLGSIVLVKPQNTIVGQVVDGQQRLTTLTIMAAVLRDIADNPQEREALGAAVYIEPNPFKDQSEAVRVRAHERDRGFFREAIQMPGATARAVPPNAPSTEAQGSMWKNAAKLRERALTLATEDRQSLVTYFLHQCVLVVVATESRGAALRIFRVLNDRGLDLSNADVIKADLLDKFTDQAQLTHYADRWRQWESDLHRDPFEHLLETLRFIREKDKNRRALSEAFADRFRNAAANDVIRFFQDELNPAKDLYAQIIDADAKDFPLELRHRASEALVGLGLIPNKDWVPAALAAALRLRPTEALVSALERLEGLAWSMELSRRYDTQRLRRYVDVLNGLENGEQALTNALMLTAAEDTDAWGALGGPLYTTFPTRVVRAMLERLDRLLSEQVVVWDGVKTVEHILPQNPAPNTWEHFTPVEREKYTHTLGNLVLLTRRKNSSASNFSFTDKKTVYFGLPGQEQNRRIATYASVQELAHLTAWDSITYQARHKRHIQILADRWGIRPPAETPI